MNCKECGKELKDGNDICLKCRKRKEKLRGEIIETVGLCVLFLVVCIVSFIVSFQFCPGCADAFLSIRFWVAIFSMIVFAFFISFVNTSLGKLMSSRLAGMLTGGIMGLLIIIIIYGITSYYGTSFDTLFKINIFGSITNVYFKAILFVCFCSLFGLMWKND